MAEHKVDPERWRIAPMTEADAWAVGRLYRREIPWAIFSIMGDAFTVRFIRWIHAQKGARVWVAKNELGEMGGISGGTINKPKIYRQIVHEHFAALVGSVLTNFYRPAVLAWLLRAAWGFVHRARELERTAPRPTAEWLFLTVVEEARGTGLAQRFRLQMEAAFREWGLNGPYMMLPLASNLQAQAFHKKHGAKLVARIRTRGHLIYELQKELPPGAQQDA